MEQLTVIQLTDADAKLFIQFQKRHALMELLESLGAFDLKSGYVSIHFDNLGGIGSVDVHKHYRVP